MEDTTTHYYYYYRVRSGGLPQQSAGYEAVTAMASVALCCAAWKCRRECLADHHGAALSLQMLPKPLSQQ